MEQEYKYGEITLIIIGMFLGFAIGMVLTMSGNVPKQSIYKQIIVEEFCNIQ